MFEYLRRNDIVIPRLRGRKPVRKKVFLSKQEIDTLMENIKKEDRRVALLLKIQFETDSRIAEILNLMVENIDLRNDRYIVRGTGKGNKEFEAFLTLETAEEIIELVKAKELNSQKKLFPEDIYYAKVNGILKRISKDCLGKEVTTHAMKRACVKYLRELGWDPLEIKKYSRHEKFDTTLGYFEDIEDAKIEERWKKTIANASSLPRQTQAP